MIIVFHIACSSALDFLWCCHINFFVRIPYGATVVHLESHQGFGCCLFDARRTVFEMALEQSESSINLGWNGWTWVPQSSLDVSWTPNCLRVFVGTSGTSHMHVGRQAQVFLCVICMTRHFDLLKIIFHVFSQWQSEEISSWSCRKSESFFIRPHKNIV